MDKIRKKKGKQEEKQETPRAKKIPLWERDFEREVLKPPHERIT